MYKRGLLLRVSFFIQLSPPLMGSPFRPLLSILVYKEYRIYIVVSFLHIINGTVGAIYDNCVTVLKEEIISCSEFTTHVLLFKLNIYLVLNFF